MALLTYYCIEGVGSDNRDAVFAFAIVHNAAILAGLNPHALFAKARALADPKVAVAIDSFVRMSAEEKGMGAFMLKVVRGPDGQPQLSVSM